jgi:hypothetical protein
VSSSAILIVAGVGTLELPWWPTELEYSGLAPGYTDIERPGRTPIVVRSSEPLESLRIAFTLRGPTLADSAAGWTNAVRVLSRATPLCKLMLGPSDRGTWRVVEAGYSEADWTADGSPAVADVVIVLRQASDAAIPVGPVPTKPPAAKK